MLLFFLLGAFCISSILVGEKIVSRLANGISPNLENNLAKWLKGKQVNNDLWQWIEKLEEYECKGCPPNFKLIDRNGKFSYSCLQFQERTFRHYIRKYNLIPYAEENEVLNFIYDCDLQKFLAYLIIEDNPNKYIYWITSVKRGLGKPPNL